MSKSIFRNLALLPCALVLTFALGCTKADLHRSLRASAQTTSGSDSPMMVAAHQPWFGQPGHIDVGYSSVDRTVAARQIEEAKALGIDAFIVNWYGARKEFEDRAYSLLQEEAAKNNFKVAIMYDEDDSNPGDHTDAVQVDLQYAYDRYISPHSRVDRSSYLRYNGRPVIFIFPKGGKTDWARIRQLVDSWEEKPLLIYKDINDRWASQFDGFYAWVQPGQRGWQPDGSNWGEEYLRDFYQQMRTKYPDKLSVGAAWPGFNDSQASWTRNRKMDARCGKTFDETLRLYRQFYEGARGLPFMMVVTWNDYEEGTAIERGYANCSGNDKGAIKSAKAQP